jgi:hypothetical protein
MIMTAIAGCWPKRTAKRLALVNLLLDEKAKDRLTEQSLRARLAGLDLNAKPKP